MRTRFSSVDETPRFRDEKPKQASKSQKKHTFRDTLFRDIGIPNKQIDIRICCFETPHFEAVKYF